MVTDPRLKAEVSSRNPANSAGDHRVHGGIGVERGLGRIDRIDQPDGDLDDAEAGAGPQTQDQGAGAVAQPARGRAGDEHHGDDHQQRPAQLGRPVPGPLRPGGKAEHRQARAHHGHRRPLHADNRVDSTHAATIAVTASDAAIAAATT